MHSFAGDAAATFDVASLNLRQGAAADEEELRSSILKFSQAVVPVYAPFAAGMLEPLSHCLDSDTREDMLKAAYKEVHACKHLSKTAQRHEDGVQRSKRGAQSG